MIKSKEGDTASLYRGLLYPLFYRNILLQINHVFEK